MRSLARAKQARRAAATAAAETPRPLGQCHVCGRITRDLDRNKACTDRNVCEARQPALFRLT